MKAVADSDEDLEEEPSPLPQMKKKRKSSEELDFSGASGPILSALIKMSGF